MKESIIIKGELINGKSVLIAEDAKINGKLEALTEEQQLFMLQVRDEWVNLALKNNTKGIDKPMFEDGIKWLYKDLLKKKAPKVVYCDSWLSCLMTIAILKNLPAKQVENIKLGASVWASVWASVGDSVGDSVGASVWASVRDSVREYSNYNGWSNFGWVSFYDFFERINMLDNFKFKQYKKLIKSNCFNAYEYENFVFAIQPPVKIERNNTGRLHSPSGPAIEFKDGYCQYYINGRNIPENIYLKAQVLTKEQFLSEQNSDYKGAWYEILGQQKMMDMLGAKEVDSKIIAHKNGDIETVALYKTIEVFEEIDNQPFAWVKMVCPSTGTQYLQGVEPHHTCALDAIVSLSGFKKEEYSFDYRS